jgi:hypothetical protein
VVAGIAPALTATPAFAAGLPQTPGATINNTGGSGLKQNGGGTSAGNFTLRIPAGAVCPGDSVSGGWHVSAFMTLVSDPSTLNFSGGDPTPAGFGTSFNQPLRDTSGNPIDNLPVNVGDGAVINIPNMSFSSFDLGNFDTTATRVYNLGLACVQNGTTMDKFWSVKMTITPDTSANGGTPQIHWENGTTPAAPTLTAATAAPDVAATGKMTVTYTNPAANPALTNCHITLAITSGGAQAFGFDDGACTGSHVFTGLTYGQQYFARATATNSVGTSGNSNELSATPVRPAVTNLSATPSPNTVTLNWDDAPLLAGGEVYNIDSCTSPATSPCTPASAGHVSPTATSPTSDYTLTGTAGQAYAFTVTYGAPGTSLGASTTATPLSNSILIQDVAVTRPSGALVLTQVCGQYGDVPAEPASTGFPAFAANAPAGNATGNTPSGPTLDDGSGHPTATTDPNYPSQYPNPASPNYPTHCSVDLGTAQLVTSGAGAGQFFAAAGRLNQVTVVDSRELDPGWTLSATMGTFNSGVNHFSGNQLGWTNTSADTPGFTDGSGSPYDQTVANDPAVAPNTVGGAGTSHPMAHAAGGSGLGVATVDARLKVLIPINARNGTYAGTLTVTAA